MTKKIWTKEELKLYILMFCARVDQVESPEEISFIKSKYDTATYDRLYKEFCEDCEEDCFEKIEDVIGKYPFSPKEIYDIKKDVIHLFKSDKKFEMKERYLEKVLDTILY